MFMFTVTEAAGAYLTQLLDKSTIADDAAVRIVPSTQGDLRLRLDTLRSDDTMFEHEGRTVLVIDTQIAQRLVESTLDVEDAEEGFKFVLRTLKA
jgi:Fe-S cluster assembly iron-binding protein IscA